MRSCRAALLKNKKKHSEPVQIDWAPKNVGYNFHSPTDANVLVVGSYVWVHVLQIPRAERVTHALVDFCWTRSHCLHGPADCQLFSSGVVTAEAKNLSCKS